jgi:RNA polymerase sigma factor (sigma-70 family)
MGHADHGQPRPDDADVTRASLLSRVRAVGDGAAWTEFEARYRELVYSYCRRQGLQHVDAEDCTQAVLVNMVRFLPGFQYDRERGRFRDYLHRCTKNIIIRYRSRPANAPARVELDMHDLFAHPRATSTELETAWEEEWAAHHMRRALAAVREHVAPQTMAIFEACLRGLSAADVARECGVSTDSVQKAKQRMRDRLQAQIRLQIEEEDGAHG